MSVETAESSRALKMPWVVTPHDQRPFVFGLSIAEDGPFIQPPLPLFESIIPPQPSVVDFIEEEATINSASSFVVPQDQLALFAEALPTREEQQTMYHRRLGLLYDEKAGGAVTKNQLPQALASLNQAFGKPAEWSIEDELALGKTTLRGSQRASWQYLMGANPQADLAYDQSVHTSYGELHAHKQEFSIGALQGLEEDAEAVNDRIDELDAARFRALDRRSMRLMELNAPYGATIARAYEAVDEWIQAEPTTLRRTVGRVAKVGITMAGAMAAASCAFGPAVPPGSFTPAPLTPGGEGSPASPAVTPTAETFPGSADVPAILAVPGVPAGFGGVGELIQPYFLTAALQDRLNAQGYAPVVDVAHRISQVLSQDGVKLCVMNTPEQLFNPNVVSGRDADLGIQNGMRGYGEPGANPNSWFDDELRFKALTAVSISGLPEGLTCVNAVVVDPDNPAGLSALRTLLVNETTGDVVGEMPGVFAAGNNNVEFRWGSQGPTIFVNGEELAFALRPGALPTAIPPASATPEATATTPPPKFECWVPGEPNEVNQLVFDETFEDQMRALVAEEESCLSDWGITTESLWPPFLIDGTIVYNKASEAPYQYLYMSFVNMGAQVTTSVSRVFMPSGNTQWVIGLPTKREGSSRTAILHFMLDRQGSENLQGISGGMPPEMLSDEAILEFLNSDRLQRGFMVSPFIAFPGGPEYPDNFIHWGDSVELIQTQLVQTPPPVDLGITGVGINGWVGSTGGDPEWERKYLNWAKTKIFPVLTFTPVAKAP